MNRIFVLSFLLLTLLSSIARSGDKTVLIIYYSVSGTTETMAKAVAEGCKSVPHTLVAMHKPDQVTKEDLEQADAIILGSPTYYANMAAPLKLFIDDWFTKYKVPLTNKVGAAFSTGGGMTAGREFAIVSMLLAMLNNGMIIVGPLYDGYGTFGVSAVTDQPDPGISDFELSEARRLGERVASVCHQINPTP